MLTELNIKNLAIIDELKINFIDGLNIISGETGAGKSIIIGAVNLLLGDRASGDVIRTSEDSAVVEALFDIGGEGHIKKQLEQMGFDDEGDELVLRRVVSKVGKNRIYINGSSATAGMLSSLGELLVNICGQHEHQSILNAGNHIDIVDEFGNLVSLRREFSDTYDEYQFLKKRLDELKSINEERHEKEELIRFQLEEIESSGIEIGEDSSLLQKKSVLSNAIKLKEHAGKSYDMLYAAEGSILENLDSVSGYIKEIRKIDSRLEVMPEEMDSLLMGLEEVAFALRDYMGGLSFDPAELEEIEDRLEYINRLKRKYGGTIEGIFAKKEEVEAELNCIISLDEEIERISRELLEKEKLLTGKARVLSFERVKTAKVLESEIENEMQGMRMSNASFEIVFSEKFEDGEIPVLHSKGADAVEFYISTNIGEEPKPLNRIASGGELSRIVLAIKKVLAGKESVGTVIFDEVDAGIGGAVAEVVGRKLKDVSEHHQVVCITHLPQIACFGDTHFLVSKDISEGKTKTSVSLLGKSERLEEITRMLGGVEVTEKTRQHASEMLKTSK